MTLQFDPDFSSSEKPAQSLLLQIDLQTNNDNFSANFDEFVEEDQAEWLTISKSPKEQRCCACPTTVSRIPKSSDDFESTETDPPTTITTESIISETNPISTEDINNFDETTEAISEPTNTNEIIPDDQDQSSDDVNAPPQANNPFSQYFERLKTIYELDLKILEQLADLLTGVDEEVLPSLMTSLEPILPIFISQQVNNIDLAQVIGYVAQAVQKSTFHVGMSAHLSDLDFIKIGMVEVLAFF